MWWTKACPKCGGDLFEDKLLRDLDVKCLQCGFVVQDQNVLDLKEGARPQDTSPSRHGSVRQAA